MVVMTDKAIVALTLEASPSIMKNCKFKPAAFDHKGQNHDTDNCMINMIAKIPDPILSQMTH